MEAKLQEKEIRVFQGIYCEKKKRYEMKLKMEPWGISSLVRQVKTKETKETVKGTAVG